MADPDLAQNEKFVASNDIDQNWKESFIANITDKINGLVVFNVLRQKPVILNGGFYEKLRICRWTRRVR